MLLALAPLWVAISGCANSQKKKASVFRGARSSPAAPAKEASAAPVPAAKLTGDDDDDDGAGESPSNNRVAKLDADTDLDNDRTDNENKGYYDRDDEPVRRYGRQANPGELRALSLVAKRYYAAAAAGDGAGACSLLEASFARAIPEDYGQAPGPIYLRGRTCAAVMSLFFAHQRSQLSTSMRVTAVRIAGSRAYVLLGARREPASYLPLQESAGSWKVTGLIGTALP